MNQLRGPNSFGEEKAMKTILSAAAPVVPIVATVACATSLAERSKREIVGLTADEVRWFTPPYYNDGRQRAQLFGDSSHGGAWIDRVKIPAGARVFALPCIRQRRKGEAPSSTNGLKRPEVSLETL